MLFFTLHNSCPRTCICTGFLSYIGLAPSARGCLHGPHISPDHYSGHIPIIPWPVWISQFRQYNSWYVLLRP